MSSRNSPPLIAAVVGGGMGGRFSMDALSASPAFQLVAAADLRDEVRRSLEETYAGLRTYRSHEELFASEKIDVACVSTFAPSHEEVALRALQSPGLRGILVEKPLGHTVASGKRIMEAVRAARLPMATPHNLVARKVSLEILERLQNGEIGSLRLVEIQNRGWDIINAGIHWLHFFAMLTPGDPVSSVLAQCDTSTRTFRDGFQVETLAVTSAITRSGVRCILHSGDFTPVNHEGADTLFRLLGTKGWIEFYGWSDSYRIQNASHPDVSLITPEPLPVVGHRFHLERLAANIESASLDYSVSDASLAALEICEAAYVSAQHACEVILPLEQFRPPAKTNWVPGQPYSGEGGGRDGRNL